VTTFLQVSLWLVAIATTMILIWAFVRTRNPGHLLLLLAVPGSFLAQRLIAPIMTEQVERIVRGDSASFPFSFLSQTSAGEFIVQYQYGIYLIQGILILIGILFLVRGGAQKEAPEDSNLDRKPSETGVRAPA
jgi:hypothetical protein